MTTPLQLPAWKALETHYPKIADLHMRDLFRQDPGRFAKFSVRFGDILLDYSKNRITDETFALLIDLARQADLPGWIEKMFTGRKINVTEDRAVLHVALRNRSNRPIDVDGKDVCVLDRGRFESAYNLSDHRHYIERFQVKRHLPGFDF